jgi:hypothetical protein
MMHFNVKRYLHGALGRRLWLLLILLIPLAYLSWSAIRSDRFSVKQSISIAKESPVAFGVTPVGFERMGDIVARPDNFFQNNFTVRKLYSDLHTGTAMYGSDGQFNTLFNNIKNNMSLTMPDDNVVTITYHGRDQKLGKTLVGYYSKRLVQKAKEGLDRSKLRNSKSQLPKLKGSMEVEEHRALWRSERLSPLVVIFIISLIAVMALLAVLEWTDLSFKSERQVARYLGLPILGSLPDLSKISAELGATHTS